MFFNVATLVEWFGVPERTPHEAPEIDPWQVARWVIVQMVTSGLRPNAVPISPSAFHTLQVGLTGDHQIKTLIYHIYELLKLYII